MKIIILGILPIYVFRDSFIYSLISIWIKVGFYIFAADFKKKPRYINVIFFPTKS